MRRKEGRKGEASGSGLLDRIKVVQRGWHGVCEAAAGGGGGVASCVNYMLLREHYVRTYAAVGWLVGKRGQRSVEERVVVVYCEGRQENQIDDNWTR